MKILPYLSLLYQDEDCDWSYLLILIRKKVSRMFEEFSKDKMTPPSILRDMSLVIKCIDIAIDMDFKASYHGYVNLHNGNRFMKLKMFSPLHNPDLRGRKAWNLIWTILNYKAFSWWI